MQLLWWSFCILCSIHLCYGGGTKFVAVPIQPDTNIVTVPIKPDTNNVDTRTDHLNDVAPAHPTNQGISEVDTNHSTAPAQPTTQGITEADPNHSTAPAQPTTQGITESDPNHSRAPAQPTNQGINEADPNHSTSPAHPTNQAITEADPNHSTTDVSDTTNSDVPLINNPPLTTDIGKLFFGFKNKIVNIIATLYQFPALNHAAHQLARRLFGDINREIILIDRFIKKQEEIANAEAAGLIANLSEKINAKAINSCEKNYNNDLKAFSQTHITAIFDCSSIDIPKFLTQNIGKIDIGTDLQRFTDSAISAIASGDPRQARIIVKDAQINVQDKIKQFHSEKFATESDLFNKCISEATNAATIDMDSIIAKVSACK